MINPHAFPSPGVVIDHCSAQQQQGAYEGMSLRDYFAAQAMQGYFSRPELLHEVGNDTNLAKEAYALADAMLAERAK